MPEPLYGETEVSVPQKDELLAELDGLLTLIRGRSTSTLALIVLPTTLASRVSDLAEKCIDLQKRVNSAADDYDALLDLQRELIDLEIWVRRRIAKNNLFPTVVIVYLGGAAFFWLLQSVDLAAFVKRTLGVEAPEKLITLGIAGAFLYLATSALGRFSGTSAGGEMVGAATNFAIRLLLAIVVPIVLVVLFFNPDGTVKDVELSPELLSFTCGYSAKLVIDIFNKLVEKGSKMIEAI